MTFVPQVTARSKREIENDARRILKAHFPANLEAPQKLDVLEFWELLEDAFSLMPGVAELSDGVEGMTWPDGRVQVNEETYRNATNGNGRARFTMCHEAYHGIQHRSQIRRVLMDSGELTLFRRSELDARVDPEWQANAFAAAILMPASMVRAVWKEARDKPIEDMIYYFGVSKTAASIRLRTLKRSGYLHRP